MMMMKETKKKNHEQIELGEMTLTIRSLIFCLPVSYPEISTSKFAEIELCLLLHTSVELGLIIKQGYGLRVLKDMVTEENIWV